MPAAHAAWVARKLDLHGIRHELVARALPRVAALAFRADEAVFSPAPFEGRQTVKLIGRWLPETHAITAGALFVPIAQPHARRPAGRWQRRWRGSRSPAACRR